MTTRAARVAWPSPGQVLLLQSVRADPCVSVLASTTPSSRMTDTDARRLRGLADDAAVRLTQDGAPDVHLLRTALDEVIAGASRQATGEGIAVYVSPHVREVVRLPAPVPDRVVIDATFATRDLVRALHRTPRHVVLLLGEREARLMVGVADELRPPPRSAFPLTADGAPVDAFLRRVDEALGTHLQLHPAPLVLVGPEHVVGRFRRQSRNTHRLAGTLDANLARFPVPILLPRIREVLQAYFRSRQDEALAHLDRQRPRQAVVEGIDSCWLAARRERPEMLVVEEGFTYPARLSPDGDLLTPADDVEHPDVVDDVVDELIETVLLRGGWIAFVDDGALTDHGRVALTVR